jgi:hypothetical protein
MSTQYLTWEAFLAGTTHSYRLEWCRGKADQASRPRLKTPIVAKVTAVQVLDVLMAARGRCCCCGSLAVSKLPRPGLPRGEAVDRRVGSLEHTIALIDGGMNDPDNFAWSCQWCNANRHGRTDLIPRTLAGCRPSAPWDGDRMNTEQPMMAELEQLAAEHPETASFLGMLAPLAAHDDQAAQRWETSTRDEPCDVIRIRRRPSVPRGTVTG